MKKISAIIVALMLIAALFAGCGLPAEILRVEPTEESAASAETGKKTKKEKKSSAEPTVSPDKKTKKGETAVHETEAPEEALPSVPDVLYIGYDPDYAPFTYDGGSRVEGFEADLAIAVCESLGIEPVFVPIEWDAKEGMLEAGDIDCVWSGICKKEWLEDTCCFTSDYYDDGYYCLTVYDNGEPEYIANFNGSYEWIASDAYPDAQITTFSEDAMYETAAMLMEGGMSAVTASAPQILSLTRYLAELGCPPPDETKLTCIFDMRYCVGFRAEDTALRDIVDEAIKALVSDGTADELALKYGLAADPDEILDFPEKMGIELNNGVIK